MGNRHRHAYDHVDPGACRPSRRAFQSRASECCCHGRVPPDDNGNAEPVEDPPSGGPRYRTPPHGLRTPDRAVGSPRPGVTRFITRGHEHAYRMDAISQDAANRYSGSSLVAIQISKPEGRHPLCRMNSTIAAQSISIATAAALPVIFCMSKSPTSATRRHLSLRPATTCRNTVTFWASNMRSSITSACRRRPPRSSAGRLDRFLDEKVQFDTTALVFAQTCLGLPIREAALTQIHLRREPLQILSAQSTLHSARCDWSLQANEPQSPSGARCQGSRGTSRAVRRIGTSYEMNYCGSKASISSFTAMTRGGATGPGPGTAAGASWPGAAASARARFIENGRHDVAAEIVFVLGTQRIPDLHWTRGGRGGKNARRAVRPAADRRCRCAGIPRRSHHGCRRPTANANNAQLNPVRTSVLLRGLAAATPEGTTR